MLAINSFDSFNVLWSAVKFGSNFIILWQIKTDPSFWILRFHLQMAWMLSIWKLWSIVDRQIENDTYLIEESHWPSEFYQFIKIMCVCAHTMPKQLSNYCWKPEYCNMCFYMNGFSSVQWLTGQQSSPWHNIYEKSAHHTDSTHQDNMKNGMKMKCRTG